jgi:hypothetical protein
MQEVGCGELLLSSTNQQEALSMERELARIVMDKAMSIEKILEEITEALFKISDEDEQKSLRRAIGSMGIIIAREIIRPIAREYPELDPDNDI